MSLPRLILLFCLACAPVAAAADLLVFAAASLKEPLDRIAAARGDVTVAYGGSGTLARQITQGAPADVVLLANTRWMDALVESGHVEAPAVTDFASNRLVLIGPAGTAPLDLTAPALLDRLGAEGRIAVGITTAVPAGIYAKDALQNLDLWPALQGRLAETDNVRAALALVARGQAVMGIVYASDAQSSDAVQVLAVFPEPSHAPIRYVAAPLTTAPEAAAFVQSLVGDPALAAAGFLPPVEATR